MRSGGGYGSDFGLGIRNMKRHGNISMKEIRSIAKRIAMKFNIEKIILFGSHVYGVRSEGSDIDFLVIATSNVSRSELRYRIYTELKDIAVPLDVVIREPRQVETAKQRRDWFLMNILKHGRPVYGD